MRLLPLAVLALLAGAAPAEAGPLMGIIGAIGGAFKALTATAVGSAIWGVAQSVGVSLLGSFVSRRLQRRRGRSGIETRFTTTGGTDPQGFVMGRFAVGGHLVYANSHGKNNRMLTRVVEYSDLPGLQPARIIVDGEYSDLGATPHPEYGFPVLTKTRPNGAERGWVKFLTGAQVAADAGLVARYGSDAARPWTADRIGTGLCWAIWTWQLDQKVHRGVPETMLEWQGLPLYDPRADSSVGGDGPQRWNDPATWAPTDNAVVMIYNIKRGIRTPTDEVWGDDVAAADLPLTSWVPAMNACDVDQGGRPRFRAGRYVAFLEPPNDVVDDLLEACAGRLAELGGTWWILVGEPGPPVVHITDEDLADILLDSDPLPGLQSVYNGAVVTYRSPEALWQPREAPRIDNADWRAQDGTARTADLALEAVYDSGQAGQLGIALVRDSRRWRRHVVVLPPRLAELRPLLSLSWTSKIFGYADKLFLIGEYEIDPMTLRATVELREWDPEDFDAATEYEFPDPPLVTVPIERQPSPVPGFAVEGVAVLGADGGARRPGILASWDPEELLDGPAELVALQWRVVGQTQTGNATAAVAEGNHLVRDVLPGTAFEVRARLIGAWLETPWTDWKPVATPDLRIGPEDLPEGATLPFVQAALPAQGGFVGQLVYLTADDNLYKWTGAEWRIIVDASPTGISGQVFAYQRAGALPAAPAGGTFDFATLEFATAPSGDWSLGIPPGEDPVWVSQALALAEDSGSVSQTLSWSTPRLFLSGGLNGEPGLSTFLATVFRRSTSTPATPSGGSFNFAAGTLSPPSGWSATIPSGSEPLWAATYLFIGPTPAGSVSGGTWATPRQIARDGVDGDPGDSGVSTFVYPVFRRASAPPAAPSGGLWNFGLNAGTPPSGWSNSPPASGTGLVYQSTALATIVGSAGIDSSLTWSTPVAIEGASGTPARLLRLSATGQVFTFSGTGEASPASQTITLTASPENMSGTASWVTDPAVTLDGSGNTRTLSVAAFGAHDRVTVTATLNGISDSITVYRLRDGDSAYTVISSNEAHNLPASAAGAVSSFAGSETTIAAFFGVSPLAFTTGGAFGSLGVNTFRILSIVNGPGISGPISASSATVGAITGMANDSGWRDITVRVRGSGSSATQQDIVRRQSFAKSRGGAAGEVGDRGPGRWYIPTSSNGGGALPTSSGAVQALWDATFGTGFTPRPRDQVIVFRGTMSLQTAQNAWIRNAANTLWEQQTEFVDGNLLVLGTVTAGALDSESLAVAGLAVFGGSLQSADYTPGAAGAGWKISADGAAEFGTLALRENAVSDAYTLVGAGNDDARTTPHTLASLVVEVDDPSPALIHFAGEFERRGGSGNSRIVVYRDDENLLGEFDGSSTQNNPLVTVDTGNWAYKSSTVFDPAPPHGSVIYSLRVEKLSPEQNERQFAARKVSMAFLQPRALKR